ncbi:transcriptional regulator [Lysinibacillus contaminans]|uniref:Transcriptional regulator n=1 Tax=Lysinibacillus contaminans TaxID=1293441 RepID=A0ABR5K627_9BACI|nr:MarR family transcriptional regulator [Lysinibacillus contaminans]KOS71693.1 transcriptional regulator [Lysinibacillus contaminans]
MSNSIEFEELYMEFQRNVSVEWQKRLDRLVSGSQATILRSLAVNGPQNASTLAERLRITPGAVTSLSDKLISSGYAHRSRDVNDRRVVLLEITDQGREILQQFIIENKNVVKQLFSSLPEEDINHLIRIYQHVLANIATGKEVESE